MSSLCHPGTRTQGCAYARQAAYQLSSIRTRVPLTPFSLDRDLSIAQACLKTKILLLPCDLTGLCCQASSVLVSEVKGGHAEEALSYTTTIFAIQARKDTAPAVLITDAYMQQQ